MHSMRARSRSILTLSGVFVSFESREVIAGGVTLSIVTLIIMIGAGAFVAGSRRAKVAALVPLWVSCDSRRVGRRCCCWRRWW